MSKLYWCKTCSAERSVELNPDGFFTPPEHWFHIFIHEPGKRRIVSNACSEHCLISILESMPVGQYLTAPCGVGRLWFCRGCRNSYRSAEIRAGSISTGSYSSIGRRTFEGPFCGPSCAVEFYQNQLAELLEAT